MTAAVVALLGCATQPEAPAGAGVGATVLQRGAALAPGRFVGSDACRECHAGAYARWLGTGHARDRAGLPAAERENSACLRCHVTGYGEASGFGAAVPGLAAVGCEACHGPGADHAGSRHPSLVPTATGGECPPCEINRICRLCHTARQSPDFDLERALERVSCARGGAASR